MLPVQSQVYFIEHKKGASVSEFGERVGSMSKKNPVNVYQRRKQNVHGGTRRKSRLRAQWGFSGPGCTEGGATVLTEVRVFFSEPQSCLLPLRHSAHISLLSHKAHGMDNLNQDYKEICLQVFVSTNKSEDLDNSSERYIYNSPEAEPVSDVQKKYFKQSHELYLRVRSRQPLRWGNYGYRASLSPHGWIWGGRCWRGHVKSRRREGNGTLLFPRRDGGGTLAEDTLGHVFHVVYGRVHGIRHLLLGLGHKVGVFGQRSQTPAHQSLGEKDKFNSC